MSSKQTQLTSYFRTKPGQNKPTPIKNRIRNINKLAESLATKLHSKPVYITEDGSSWYILVKRWLLPKSQKDFDIEWNLHPSSRRQVQIFGKSLYERRWSQAWGVSMVYSGLEQKAKAIKDSTIVPTLLIKINDLMEGMPLDEIDCDASDVNQKLLYNACLQNWYEPNDSMGLHSDDESYIRHRFPIFSLSWGGTRRFLFRSKSKGSSKQGESERVELWLEDGDLLVMGGLCQNTHKHEVPKLRSTMDPPTSNRINWTIRPLK